VKKREEQLKPSSLLGFLFFLTERTHSLSLAVDFVAEKKIQ
jgi:hypothetical protein